MLKDVLVDVIVPVYKVEAYLEKCINSLLNQTFTDYVITLVDDGSPDECPSICDHFQQAYPNKIRVIHKENGGLSDARNVGVRNSQAQFVIFVDSDDYVSERMIEELYMPYAEIGADMVVASFCREYVSENGDVKQVDEALHEQRIMNRDEALEALFYENGFGAFACEKLIPRELALRYPYPVGRIFEDSFTTYRQIFDCEKVVCIPNAEYFYLQRKGGIQRRPFEDKHMDLFYSVEEMMKYILNQDVSDAVKIACAYRFCNSCYVTLHHASDLDYASYKKICRQIVPEYRKHFFAALKGNVPMKKKLMLLLVYFNPLLLRHLVRYLKK